MSVNKRISELDELVRIFLNQGGLIAFDDVRLAAPPAMGINFTTFYDGRLHRGRCGDLNRRKHVRMIDAAKRKSGSRTEGRIRARNRALILRAAQEVFAKKGFDGTTIAEIAKGSGLPKANIYYYFGSKKGVYRAVIAALLSEWNAAFEHIAAGREPDKAIEAYVRAKLDFSRRNMSASKIFANENVRGSAFLSPQELRNIRSITREKAKVIERWIKANTLSPVDPVHLFIMLWAATQFYADFNAVVCNVLGVKRLTRTHFDDAAACITAVALHGLAHRRTRSRTRSSRPKGKGIGIGK